MCGIAGFIGLENFRPSKKNINDCLKSLKRRGPDSKGVFQRRINNKRILLLHTRLSIIDLNKNSNQPFFDDEGSIIFNGMIYNYIELKKDLMAKGIVFKTKSDTEVLLKMMNIYGEKAFKYLDGMWSMAYYNFKKNQLILSRDRFGEKPLYYFNNKNGFYFSNSIKALQKLSTKKLKFNMNKIEALLKYPDKSIGLNENSIFENIYQLKSSEYLKISTNSNKFKKVNFWKLRIKQNKMSFKSASKELKKLLKNTIKTRVRSNVKNSMLISGGLDSNTIASYAKDFSKIKGYSLVSSNKEYDETYLIKKSVKKNKFSNNFVKSSNGKSLSILESIIQDSYNVLPTTSSLGFALLCEKIKKDQNKMILTGVGGDELFAGYYVNYLAHILSFKGKKFYEKYDFWKNNLKKFIRNENLKNFSSKKLKKNLFRLNFYIENDQILKYYFKNKSSLKIKKLSKDIFYNNMLQHLFIQNVPTQNVANDLVSMHYSLESRAPFLSYKIFDFIYSTKKDYFMYKGLPKSLLRETVKNKLDQSVLKNLEKIGFYSPFFSFFSRGDKRKIFKYIKNSKLIYKFIKKTSLLNLIKSQDNKNVSHSGSKFLFSCLNFAILEQKLKLS